MYIDKELLLSDAQAFTVDANTANTILLSTTTPKIDIGAGERLVIMLQVDVAADHTTADETYLFNLIHSASADLSGPEIIYGRTILYSDLTAGSLHEFPIPALGRSLAYMGIAFDGGGTTPTITGTIWMTLQSMVDRQHTYAKGYTVS